MRRYLFFMSSVIEFMQNVYSQLIVESAPTHANTRDSILVPVWIMAQRAFLEWQVYTFFTGAEHLHEVSTKSAARKQSARTIRSTHVNACSRCILINDDMLAIWHVAIACHPIKQWKWSGARQCALLCVKVFSSHYCGQRLSNFLWAGKSLLWVIWFWWLLK